MNYLRLYCGVDKLITCQFRFLLRLIHSGLNHHTSVTIGVAIISVALIVSPSFPGELHPILGTAYFALSSAMACRVFRTLLLGLINDHDLSTTGVASIFKFRTTRITDAGNQGDSTSSSNDVKASRPSNLQVNVEIEMDTPADSDEGYEFRERRVMVDQADGVRQNPSSIV